MLLSKFSLLLLVVFLIFKCFVSRDLVVSLMYHRHIYIFKTLIKDLTLGVTTVHIFIGLNVYSIVPANFLLLAQNKKAPFDYSRDIPY